MRGPADPPFPSPFPHLQPLRLRQSQRPLQPVHHCAVRRHLLAQGKELLGGGVVEGALNLEVGLGGGERGGEEGGGRG